MKVLFDKYIDNPAGDGNSVITNRSMYKNMYQNKFDAVMLREQGKLNYTLYKANDATDSHYVHFKIPSEVVPNFYYDVVVRFYTDQKSVMSEANLRRYYVQFYSNDPAFVYTFAHSFIKNEMFIEDLKPKMAKESVKKVAKVKNPNNNVWYVKSLYFAYLAMTKYNLWSKSHFTGYVCHKYSKRELLGKIEQAEKKIEKRKVEGEKIAKQKKEAEKQAKANNTRPEPTKAVKKTPIVGYTGTVKQVKKTRTTKTTKTSKRH